jgi:S1-C subfamily serine protease
MPARIDLNIPRGSFMSDSASSVLSSLSNDLADAVERGGASTVTVNARRRMPASGIVWAPDGLIVTANHVVERDDDITIGLPDGRSLPATIAGRDPGSDLAVLRIEASDLTAATKAAEEIKPGHLVLAIGRPGQSGPMASFGVVSLIGGPIRNRGNRGGPHPRPDGRGPGGPGGPGRGPRGEGFPATGANIERFIRADVAMLPGFSGGPLVTAAGEVAGLNTSFFGRWGGITLPVDVIDPIVTSLLTHGKVRRGFLGVGAQAVQLPQTQAGSAGQEIGLLVVNIEAGGPADNAGMLLGDIVLTVAGAQVTSVEALQEKLSGDLVGVETPVVILRGGSPMTIPVTVGERG